MKPHVYSLKKLFNVLCTLLLFVFLFVSTGVKSQSIETFTNIGPYGGYQLETWSGDNGHGTWEATDARTDQTINGKAITVRNGKLTSPSIPGGIDKLVLTTERKFSGGSGVLQVTVNGSNVGTLSYGTGVMTDSITNINVSGSFVLEIETPGNGDRVAMDDLTWYPYASSQKLVIFQVDMSQQPVSANGVHIAGDFQGWNYSSDMMTDQGNGIYTYQTLLDSGITYEYKFINGNAMADAESVPSACEQNGNRYFTLDNDTVLPAFLFGSCSIAPPGIPVYPIATITTVDANGEPDSIGVECEVRGIVTSTNIRPGALEFFVQDISGGMGLFKSSGNFGYTVNIGDSIHATGTVSTFAGLTQMSLDTVILAAANHAMPTPVVVDSLGEHTEGELIRINNATLVDASQWPSAGSSSTNVDIKVGNDTLSMRIDTDTDVDDNVTAPTGAFHVIGVGTQFAGFSPPYVGGYQILPRMASDIIPSTVGVPCGDLFFSEYIEGSSNNKVLEIYNPTNQTVDLSDYTIDRYNNGASTNPSVFGMAGMLAPDAVYVISHASADTVFLNQADTTGGATFFNGDDAVVLAKNGVWLDVIGRVGERPSSGSWTVGSGSTSNNTLVRKSNVNNGSLDWNIGATQWDVYASNFADSLGTHTMMPCGVAVDPELAFDGGAQTVTEYDGSTDVIVTIVNPNADTTKVEVYVKGGSAVNGTDYTFTDTTLTFLPNDGNPQSLSIGINYDPANQPNRSIILGLRNATNNATVSLDTTMITIVDVPYYPIGTVHTEDANGVADSNGVLCELRGIVNSENIRPGALQFTFEDATGGMGVFNGGGDFGYNPLRGDSIRIIGTIGQFAGLTQIDPDTVIFVSAGNELPAVTQTDTLYEELESRIVKLVGYHIIDPSQWTGSGSGFNVDITNGTDTLQVRLDADVDMYSKPVPTDSLITWVGVLGQFVFSPPHFGGYQVLPRDSNDVMATQAPVAGFMNMEDPSLTVAFTDTSSECPTMWSWSFGDGTTSDEQHPTHIYATKGTYEVCLTVSNPAGSSTICDSITVGPVGIDITEEGMDITMYPVPVDNVLIVSGDTPLEMIRVMDIQGRQVLAMPVSGDTQVEIDFSRMPKGVYVVEVEGENSVLRQQVTKQ